MGAAWEIPKTDLLIGVLSTGMATVDWATNLLVIQKPANTTLRVWRGLPYDVARNRLVRDAREAGCREIFFLDSDVLLPSDAIPKLQSVQLPIVSGLYWSKKGYPGMWRAAPEGDSYQPILQWPMGGVIEVDVMGAGCLLVDMRVFDTLDKMGLPWFEWQIKDPANQAGKFSEDFAFFRYAAKAGFKAYCHTGVLCFHEHTVAMDYQGQPRKENLM
jgi:hypothetical protein